MPPEPTPQGGEGRAQHQMEDLTLNIPNDQVPASIANAPHPAQTATYPVQINGRLEQWSLERLTTEAQTGAAGREAFQDAATQRKENSKAFAIQEDLEQVFKEGDIDAFRRLGAQYGVPGDKVEEIAQRAFGEDTSEEDENVVNSYLKEEAEGQTHSHPQTPQKVDYSSLSPDVQRVLREAEKTRIDGIVRNALDKDEIVTYNMNAHSPEGRQAIRDYVDEKIRGRLNEFSGDFGDGTQILAEVVPEIRAHLQALGTPGPRTLTGLGHAPGGGDTEVYPTKLPDHVSSIEGDAYEQNVLETMIYHQTQAERGKQQ